jgi:uncharacterized membrane protein YgaE (UPF0421/DUF939 family)
VLRYATVSRGQVVLAAKTGVAAGLAWAAAMPLDPTHRPYFAPIAAVIVVQPTVYDSLSRAAQRVGGVVVGVMAALAVAHFVTVDAWTIGIVAFVGLLIGWLLRLGPQGVVQVPVSALLVLVVGTAIPGYGVSRLYATLVGAAIGAGVALLSPPAPAPGGATSFAADTMRGAAELVRAIAAELGSSWSLTQAADWEGQASRLVEVAKEARGRMDAARLSARWNALARRARATLDRADDSLVSAERITIQVRAMARALVDGSDQARPLPTVAALLDGAADATSAVAAWTGSDGDATTLRSLARAVDDADSALRATLVRAQERWGSDATQWLTFGLVLAATQQILAEASRPLDRSPRSPGTGPLRRP